LKLCKTNIARYATGTKIPLAIGYASIAFGFFSGAVRSLWAIVGRFIHKKEKGEMTE
jgi:TRAP-type C4-dicarboxylate transport system permease small subunit